MHFEYIKLYLQFLLFLDIDMEEISEIQPPGSQGADMFISYSQ